jgi:plasmid maintenance system killer protein
MIIAPIHGDIIDYLKKRKLIKKFEKQIEMLKINKKYPSLNFEILEPKELRMYSFRVDKKYRAIGYFIDVGIFEIIDINNHYGD